MYALPILSYLVHFILFSCIAMSIIGLGGPRFPCLNSYVQTVGDLSFMTFISVFLSISVYVFYCCLVKCGNILSAFKLLILGHQHSSTLMDQLQDQENDLQQCIGLLENAERTRIALVFQLREALQEQVKLSYYAFDYNLFSSGTCNPKFRNVDSILVENFPGI